MSILRVDAIRDNGAGFNDVVTFANSGGTENGKLCRAYATFSMSGTLSIRSSFNVNSISDGGTIATVNFSNSMPDANYAIVTSQSYQLNATFVQGMQAPYQTYSASSFGMMPFSGNNGYPDADYVHFAVFR